MDDPLIQEGYVHSLGHGLGLHVHEAPWSGSGATEKDLLLPGSVATIEPGLYYPSKGMGCRLENTVAVTSDGEFEVLAEYPLDLVLSVKKS
jgi:Xaa-Pro aminopeptidase